jgi:thiol-disulfide isomerase/thioredoxin
MKYLLIGALFFYMTSASGQDISEINLYTPDGKSLTLNRAIDKKLAVVLFVSIDCPYSHYYEERIAQIINEYNSRVNFLLINPNPGEFGKSYSPGHKHNAPYYLDKEQEAAEILGVRKCPEAVIVSKSGTNIDILYSGALDDSPQLASDVQEAYLGEALKSILSGGKPEVRETRPTGCMIRGNG